MAASTEHSALPHKRVALVLGGGGLKGFAHLGVLQALAEHGIDPVVVAGTSIGALIGAAYAADVPLQDLKERAIALRRRDLFRINHVGMVMERIRNPAIYLEHPLRTLVRSVVPDVPFDELHRRVLVSTVDISRGTRLVWGLQGLRDVSVADAVYASCALPGFFPPGMVDGRLCADGGVIDNLPIDVAALDMDAVIAVDVGTTQLQPAKEVATEGFAAIFMRAVSITMHALEGTPLHHWSGPPLILVRPKLGRIDWFDFSRTAEVIEAGYTAAIEALEQYATCVNAASGVFPRQTYRISVNPAKCVACGLCVALAPDVMGLTGRGPAFPRQPTVNWSPADGDFVRQCPTAAISATPIPPVSAAPVMPPEAEE